jgi:hypothetical protein
MRKALQAALTALAVMAAVPPSSQAGGPDGWHGGHGHGHGYGYGWNHSAFRAGYVIGGFYGPGFLWPRPWGPYLQYGYGYGPAPYAYAPPPVVVQQPPQVYMQQDAREDSPYWYYCQNPQGYYPYVSRCASGWMQVVPPDAPPN